MQTVNYPSSNDALRFPANVDTTSLLRHDIPQVVKARIVRVTPTDWAGDTQCMKMELIGCVAKVLPFPAIIKVPLLINLGSEYTVTGIVIQGSINEPQYGPTWATKFTLQYAMESVDESSHSFRNYLNIDGSVKIFLANFDSVTPVTIYLDRPIVATKLYLTYYNDDAIYPRVPCIRVDFLGCLLAAQNVSREERVAIRDLKSNSNIVIRQADKGGAVTILNTVDYIKEAESQLNNSSFYKKLTYNPCAQFKKELKSMINTFSSELADEVNMYIPSSPSPGVFYTIPKLHKVSKLVKTKLASVSRNDPLDTDKLSPRKIFELAKTLDILPPDNGYLCGPTGAEAAGFCFTTVASRNDEACLSIFHSTSYPVIIKASSVNTALRSVLPQIKQSGYEYYRIGLTHQNVRNSTASNFQWVDGTPLQYQLFDSSNIANDEDELCPAIYLPDTEHWQALTYLDECRQGNSGCARDCINYPGGYACECPPGMYLNWWDRKGCECPFEAPGCGVIPREIDGTCPDISCDQPRAFFGSPNYPQKYPNLVYFSCPAGWNLFGGRCFLVVKHNGTLGWNEAHIYCLERVENESDLVSIRDQAEMSFVHELLVKGGFESDKFYIGCEPSYFRIAEKCLQMVFVEILGEKITFANVSEMCGNGSNLIGESFVREHFDQVKSYQKFIWQLYGHVIIDKPTTTSADELPCIIPHESEIVTCDSSQIQFALCVKDAINLTQHCKQNQFECESGECVNVLFVNDLREDCADGSDEKNVDFQATGSGTFILTF
ncbi:hypothetical protein HOLleu_31492 [Holothuria leucospilota]|uniref:Uncharacterized protein n=1 Tax=Holothuria leucospilota TaxID=206669 RepID=A0A9Q0YRV4_HOLLE|nr:hypothetical protein HOLleu_31492 [Holothuria leucospilota]